MPDENELRQMGRGYALLARLHGREDEPMRGCEVGVRSGELSKFMLTRFPRLHLTMVDPWTPVPEKHPARIAGEGWAQWNQGTADAFYYAAQKNTEFATGRRNIIRRGSPEASDEVEDGSLDWVFVDGDHLYDPCLADLNAWWPKIRVGGFLSGDDWDSPTGKGVWGVDQAVKDFCNARGVHYELGEVLGDSQTWYIPKEA